MARNIYEDYYLRQAGNGLPVFVGTRYQRGHGLGNILGGFARAVVPILKRGGQVLLKEGAKTGVGVLSDVLGGQSFKQAAKKRSKEVGTRLLGHASHALRNPAPPGQPNTKRIKRELTTKKAHLVTRRKKSRTRRKTDIFD